MPSGQVWDLRKEAVCTTLRGHSDTVTGLALSPDGSHLLSNAMDNTLRVWDMRPFAPQNRCVKILTGVWVTGWLCVVVYRGGGGGMCVCVCAPVCLLIAGSVH